MVIVEFYYKQSLITVFPEQHLPYIPQNNNEKQLQIAIREEKEKQEKRKCTGRYAIINIKLYQIT